MSLFRKHIEGWFLNKDRDRDGELTWDEVLGNYHLIMITFSYVIIMF